MKFLRKLQSLPEWQRKAIVWGITVLVGIGLFVWWLFRVESQLSSQQGSSLQEQLQIQELQQQLQNIPVKIPENGRQ